MAEPIQTTIGNMEKEAEKILGEAKENARKLLEEGRVKSKDILSQSVPMDDIEKEKKRILQAADEEAKIRRDTSEKRVAQVRATAPDKREAEVRNLLDALQPSKAAR